MKAKNFKKGETIFITGGMGFIGTHVAKLFREHGDKVVAYDLLRNYLSPRQDSHWSEYLKYRFENLDPRIEFIEGDVKDFHQTAEAIARVKPDKILHLAAFPIEDLSNKYLNKVISVNFHGVLNILNAIKTTPSVKKFINTSSSMVYGDFRYRPCDEEHPTDPKGAYGGLKLSGEIMTKVYSHQFGIRYVTIRPSAVYGPTDCNRRVSQIFLERAIAGEPLILHDGGSAELDFTYVEDTAQGMFLATKNDKVVNETFNITRGEGRTLREFAEILKTHFPNLKIKKESLPPDKKKPKRGALDISKAKKMLGYKPRYSLEEGIEKYVAFARDFWNLS